jgi:hypothetical protein
MERITRLAIVLTLCLGLLLPSDYQKNEQNTRAYHGGSPNVPALSPSADHGLAVVDRLRSRERMSREEFNQLRDNDTGPPRPRPVPS